MTSVERLGRRLGRLAGSHPLRAAAALMLGGCLLLAGCGGGSGGAKPTGGGTVTFAELAGTPPNYIFPMESGPFLGEENAYLFSNQMYLPLYWFGTQGQPTVNQALSIAKMPVFSDNNTVVTITLKHWRWSTGSPITARDVVFWLNLLSAVTDPNAPKVGSTTAPGPGCGFCVAGNFPENLVSYQATGTYTVKMTLNASYNPTWFLYNQLSLVYPIPQASWDKLSSSGTVGNQDASAEARQPVSGTSPTWYVPADPGTANGGAFGVVAYINSQSETTSSYATNPMWQVVDGPFHLSQFTTSGYVKMLPNKSYSGSPKPSISAFVEEPFTSDSAEFNALRSGAITIGYLPLQDTPQMPSLSKAKGYKMAPWWSFMVNYFPYNFTQPTVGKVLKQLYFRQAIQSLVNQKQYVSAFDGGYAKVENGPAPSYPPGNHFESPLLSGSMVYPYDPAKAVSLLSGHGWKVNPGEVSYCQSPGTGSGQCGAGVTQGQEASLTLLYASGNVEATAEMQALKSNLQQNAGIQLQLKSAPFSQVIGTAFGGCTAAQPCSDWAIANWLGGWTFAPDFLPTGEELFYTQAGSNAGYYSDRVNDATIAKTETAPTAQAEQTALFQYEDYLARQLPAIWVPQAPLQLTVYKRQLGGLIPQDVFGMIEPQAYHFG
jgi:peptide/nickel transport system substrate-binding protein